MVEADQDPEGVKEDEDEEEDGETPRGDQSRSLAWGGMPPPKKKTRTSHDSPQNVRTCCCRESMDTSCITMMGRT